MSLPLSPSANDSAAAAAEKFFGDRYGLSINKQRFPDHCDFLVGGYSIDVKWTPRTDGSVVTFTDCRNKCDVYVLVVGMPYHFRIAGWTWGVHHRKRVADLGHGERNVTPHRLLRADVDRMMENLSGPFSRLAP